MFYKLKTKAKDILTKYALMLAKSTGILYIIVCKKQQVRMGKWGI